MASAWVHRSVGICAIAMCRVRYDLPGMRDLLTEAKDALLLPS